MKESLLAAETTTTHIASLRDHEPHILATPEALSVARERNIVRYIKTDFGWIEAKRHELVAMLENAGLDGVLVKKQYKFAHYYFSKP